MKLHKAFSILFFYLLSNGAICEANGSSREVKRAVSQEGDYKEESAIALERRNESISKFFQMPRVDEKDLPLDLRSFRETSGLLSKDELEITNSDAETLLQKIKARKLSSVDVTRAFCKAAVIAQKLTNCVTEVLFIEGLERAQFLDDYLARTGETIGPFHGLPISLKDSFITPPHPSSIGMAIHANTATTDEAVIVSILRNLGAVFYLKTNVPTAMMMTETINNIWGETRNPIHKKLTPGGSSGGEGALLAMRASPLGVGTDIGGSVRIPSAYCHLYGLKPTFGRIPTWGTKPGIAGQDLIYSVSGPMSRSLRSVELFAESVLSEKAAPWEFDPKVSPIPWRKNVIQPKGRKLNIAILPCNDGVATCHPPVERALRIVKRTLKRGGHNVIDWEPKRQPETEAVQGEALQKTGADALRLQLEAFQEPLLGTLKLMLSSNGTDNKLDAEALRNMVLKRNQLQKDHLDQWISAGSIDGLISPVAVAAAFRLQLEPTLTYAGFTGFANLLDIPSCTFPVTYANKKLDPKRDSSWQPISQRDEMIQADYDPDFYDGAPVSLQLLGKRMEEEKVLEMVRVVADLVKFRDRL